jgi:hypothetical protein
MFEDSPAMAFYGPQYVQAAGVECTVELHLRLSIDTDSDPQKEAYEPPIKDILSVFFAQFSATLAMGDEFFLETVVKLRHKIAHGDFKAAHRIARELGAELEGGGVWKADFTSDALGPVSEATKKGGRNFGWFLEAGQSGLFLEATKIFARALETIGRIRG